MTFALYWFLGSLACLGGLILWAYFDHKNAPQGHDEACSKIDNELNEQGK